MLCHEGHAAHPCHACPTFVATCHYACSPLLWMEGSPRIDEIVVGDKAPEGAEHLRLEGEAVTELANYYRVFGKYLFPIQIIPLVVFLKNS